MTDFQNHIEKGLSLHSQTLAASLEASTSLKIPETEPQSNLVNNAAPTGESPCCEWSDEETASLLYQLFLTGDNDWKSLLIEDPTQDEEKKRTVAEVIKKARELKLAANCLVREGKAGSLPECYLAMMVCLLQSNPQASPPQNEEN